MKKTVTVLISVFAAAALVGCGGGGGGAEPAPVLVAPAEVTLAAAPATTAAVEDIPFAFPTGVPQFGTTAATTVVFTDTSTTPAFSISTLTGSATGSTTFGSCIFAVAAVTGSVGTLRVGDTIRVNPCNLNVSTSGAVANGVATTRSVALLLGAASSASSTVTVAVTPIGGLTLNGNSVGTVTLVPVSG